MLNGTYTIIDAKLISSYHFHGSWYEYSWKIKVQDKDNNVIEGVYGTWDNCDFEQGDTIKFNDMLGGKGFQSEYIFDKIKM